MPKREIEGAYYAVVPADVRYDSRLKPNAKLLYGELTALCNRFGHCWATNEYFAEIYGLSVGTISRLISQLEQCGYIRCEMVATATGSERRIYAGIFAVKRREGLDENDNTPLDEKGNGGLDENGKSYNKSNITQVIPPIVPQGGNGEKPKPKRHRREWKENPAWNPDRFEAFWKAYPKGRDKQAAIRAWDKLKPSDELIHTMAKALKRDMHSEDWQKGIGIPYAATWLNGHRWEDEDRPPVAPPPESGSGQPLRGEGVTYL